MENNLNKRNEEYVRVCKFCLVTKKLYNIRQASQVAQQNELNSQLIREQLKTAHYKRFNQLQAQNYYSVL
jgi:hypothetical protein